jgi:hypothetical protein
MAKVSLTRLVAAVGGLALSLTAGAVTASADPDLGPVINTPPAIIRRWWRRSMRKIRQLLRNCPHHRGRGPYCVVSSPRRRMSASRSSRNCRAMRGLSSTLDLSCRSPTPATTSKPTPPGQRFTALGRSRRGGFGGARASRCRESCKGARVRGGYGDCRGERESGVGESGVRENGRRLLRLGHAAPRRGAPIRAIGDGRRCGSGLSHDGFNCRNTHEVTRFYEGRPGHGHCETPEVDRQVRESLDQRGQML